MEKDRTLWALNLTLPSGLNTRFVVEEHFLSEWNTSSVAKSYLTVVAFMLRLSLTRNLQNSNHTELIHVILAETVLQKLVVCQDHLQCPLQN